MKLNSLKYFEKLIETKSYSEVAKYYGVTQPAVSMNIKRLETELNDELFIISQSAGTVKLTKNGEKLHKHAKVILQQLQLIDDGIKNQKNKVINLGVSPLISDGYFSNLLNELENSKVNLIENDTDSLLKKLEVGDLDLVLVESIAPLKNKWIQSEIIETDQINIIVSKNNPLADKKEIDFRDLKDTPFITMPNKYLQAQLFKAFEKKYDTAIPVVSCGRDPKLMNQLVQKNIGFSFSLNQWLPQDSQQELVALKLKNNELPDFMLSIAYSKLHELTKAEKSVIDLIKSSSLTKLAQAKNKESVLL